MGTIRCKNGKCYDTSDSWHRKAKADSKKNLIKQIEMDLFDEQLELNTKYFHGREFVNAEFPL